jgi:hypothetical protein
MVKDEQDDLEVRLRNLKRDQPISYPVSDSNAKQRYDAALERYITEAVGADRGIGPLKLVQLALIQYFSHYRINTDSSRIEISFDRENKIGARQLNLDEMDAVYNALAEALDADLANLRQVATPRDRGFLRNRIKGITEHAVRTGLQNLYEDRMPDGSNGYSLDVHDLQ